MSDNADADMMQLLVVREAVRVQAEIMKATGWPSFLIASEMMTQALVMAVPGVAVDDARKMTLDFWEVFLGAVQAKAKAGSGPLPGPLLPFARRPAANANASHGHGKPPLGLTVVSQAE